MGHLHSARHPSFDEFEPRGRTFIGFVKVDFVNEVKFENQDSNEVIPLTCSL